MAKRKRKLKVEVKVKDRDEEVHKSWTQLGAGEFRDTDLGGGTYSYERVIPYMRRVENGLIKVPSHKRRTLKEYAAHKLARVLLSAADVDRLIEAAPSWGVWEPVWNAVLEYELDCPRLFEQFYGHFGHNDRFQCHVLASGRNTDRSEYVVMNALTLRHRFETLYSNVSLDRLVTDLNRFDGVRILNLSGIDLAGRFHGILNLRNLIYLNLTKANLDQTAANSFTIAMKAGKLPGLVCLLLGGNDITGGLPVQYLELSRGAVCPRSFRHIDNAAFARLSDPQKLKHLVDQRLVVANYSHLLLDYRILDTPCPPAITCSDLTELWAARALSPHVRVASFIRTDASEHPVKLSSSVKRPTSTKRSVKKRRVAQLDINKFFDI